MFIIGLTGIARTTCIETTGKMPVAHHALNLCPHHQRQDRTGYDGIERETQQRLQGHAVIRHDSGIPYISNIPVICFHRQGIKHRRWKYARPCESLEGRALRISIPGVLLVATVAHSADRTAAASQHTHIRNQIVATEISFAACFDKLPYKCRFV